MAFSCVILLYLGVKNDSRPVPSEEARGPLLISNLAAKTAISILVEVGYT